MSKLANKSEDLRKAQVLTTKFRAEESIKLHREQCSRLRVKVMKTLAIGREASPRHPALYSKVFRELCRVVLRVKTFVDDCCYKCDSDFILAAIKVSAHRERFIKYHVELNWCIFLIKLVRDANGGPVVSEKLEGFDWKEKVRLVEEKTRNIVEKDFIHFKDVLRKYVQKPGDHQKICATLLRRFKEETDPVVDDDALGVPPLGKIGERIGKGGFGEVYNFMWRNTAFAIKIPGPNSETKKEVAVLEKCRHPNIVNLILFHEDLDGEQGLMMEKLAMNLLEYLQSQLAEGSPVPPLDAVGMILQVSEGMEYLGDTQVVHRDMKPQNILVKLVSGQDGPVLELQVADFGLAKVREAIEKSSSLTPNVGTTRYRAPELTLDPGADKIRGQSLKADMFSFAVTCSCILTGCEPYEEIIRADGMDGLRKFVKMGGRPSLPADCPAELASLLEECWHPEPSKRPASFFAICERLRRLKAMLLTSGVHDGDQSGPSSPENGFRERTFQSSARPLRILVLGNAKLVKKTCLSICGVSGLLVEDHPLLKESVSISPPMRLYYRVATSTADHIDYAESMSFVEVRNKRWRQDNLQAAWLKDLEDSSDTTPFPDRSLRLHMVWYVCEKLEDLPNGFEWKEITRKHNGVPVQILVTETVECLKILSKCKERFKIDNCQREDSIINVDLEDAGTKDRLWRTCWEVKLRSEIKNAATIIGYIRKRLGSSGMVVRVGATASKSKEFSVKQSMEFIVNFLFSYWEIPTSFVKVLPTDATKFLPFCLQVAAIILYREREHLGLVPDEASTEFVLREVQACGEAYFENPGFNACDKWKSGDIQGFLKAVFEREDMPEHLVSGLHRSWSFRKCVESLLGR